jgi:hypothetical protein
MVKTVTNTVYLAGTAQSSWLLGKGLDNRDRGVIGGKLTRPALLALPARMQWIVELFLRS